MYYFCGFVFIKDPSGFRRVNIHGKMQLHCIFKFIGIEAMTLLHRITKMPVARFMNLSIY